MTFETFSPLIERPSVIAVVWCSFHIASYVHFIHHTVICVLDLDLRLDGREFGSRTLQFILG